MSTVVADTQFSALGVVLIALLGSLAKAIDANAYLAQLEVEEQQQNEQQEVEVDAKLDTPGPASREISAASIDEMVEITSSEQDLGEVVGRDITPAATISVAAEPTKGKKRRPEFMEAKMAGDMKYEWDSSLRKERSRAESPEVVVVKDEKKKKKNKRKGNAIDDIFGSL
jgi:ribonuclease MRP protein subunit RMP1